MKANLSRVGIFDRDLVRRICVSKQILEVDKLEILLLYID